MSIACILLKDTSVRLNPPDEIVLYNASYRLM